MSNYLITQATGKQAQAVIGQLLAAGHSVHAVVRDTRKTLPEVLTRPGVTLFQGETVDSDVISKAIQGCKGVFLNTFPIPGIEPQQAKTVVDAAKKAGVETVVLTTTMATGSKEIWDKQQTKDVGLYNYFVNKAAAEEIVRSAGLNAYTILRPAFLHFDYFLPHVLKNYSELAKAGELVHSFKEGGKMLQTDVEDVGKYAAAALQDPAKFGGHEIELGNEALTIQGIAAILSKVSGKNVTPRQRSSKEVEEAKGGANFQAWQLWTHSTDLTPFAAAAKDVQEKFGIPFTSLERALQRERDQLLECLSASA
ncbi:hypothetical protein FSARC_3028 [Fusarium sarcochroum]|uniref:NmrA-like domain-containing protein n=1 Tax=Fusarium sarcochroum TaxID=1208366 RepID=A0A8H4U5E0_9HYPO|nr:hypothetical protein FSARC_3028 [Fusarium sarcochroum]